MIVTAANRRLATRSRSAFTLLEVLVVVAILVVLASVSSIYVFRYLEDAKKDKAIIDMQVLEKTYKAAIMKNGGEEVTLQQMIPLLEQGSNALNDPWGGTYQMRMIQSEVGPRPQFYTVHQGEEIFWPRQ